MNVVLVEHAGCTLPCHVEKMIPHDQTWIGMSAQMLEGQYSQNKNVMLPASHQKKQLLVRTKFEGTARKPQIHISLWSVQLSHVYFPDL